MKDIATVILHKRASPSEKGVAGETTKLIREISSVLELAEVQDFTWVQ